MAESRPLNDRDAAKGIVRQLAQLVFHPASLKDDADNRLTDPNSWSLVHRIETLKQPGLRQGAGRG